VRRASSGDRRVSGCEARDSQMMTAVVVQGRGHGGRVVVVVVVVVVVAVVAVTAGGRVMDTRSHMGSAVVDGERAGGSGTGTEKRISTHAIIASLSYALLHHGACAHPPSV
jgi:hypothetical protein